MGFLKNDNPTDTKLLIDLTKALLRSDSVLVDNLFICLKAIMNFEVQTDNPHQSS